METIKMVWKSKMNVCMCSPPRICHVYKFDKESGETTHIVLGDQPPNCFYCGKPWEDH